MMTVHQATRLAGATPLRMQMLASTPSEATYANALKVKLTYNITTLRLSGS